MSVIEKKSEKVDEKSKPKKKYRVVPRYGTWTEEDHVILQVAIPGVPRDSIKMKALEDFFTLRATRDNIVYYLDLDFGVKIEPQKTDATYEEGLLRVKFKRYKPLEHAYDVKIE